MRIVSFTSFGPAACLSNAYFLLFANAPMLVLAAMNSFRFAAGRERCFADSRKHGKARTMTREVPALKGAFTPLVAPFRSGVVDYDLYAKLIDWQIEQGAQGLLVNATSGEPTTLIRREGQTDRSRGQNLGGPQAGRSRHPGRVSCRGGYPSGPCRKGRSRRGRFSHTLLCAAPSARSHIVFRRPRCQNRTSLSNLSHPESCGGVGGR